MPDKSRTYALLSVGAAVTMLIGFALIGLTAFSAPGRDLHSFGAGGLTAFAALAAGSLIGFLFGIPRVVSSGELRHQADRPALVTTTETDTTKTRTETVPATAPGTRPTPSSLWRRPRKSSPSPTPPPKDTSESGPVEAKAAVADGEAGQVPDGMGQTPAATQFSPSTNLAEVSDWLTKLLLGAGLVGLTQLGGPLGTLVNTVAGGLETSTSQGPSTGAQVVAASTMILFWVVGFLAGYVVTTLWYGRRIRFV